MEKKNKLGITGPVMMYVVMFLAYALKNFHSYATSMTASLLQTDLGLTAAQVSLYIAAYTWTNAIVQLPAGIVCDRWSAKKLLGFSYIAAAVGCLLVAYSGSLAGIVIGRVILTVGISFVFNVCSRHIAAWNTAGGYRRANSLMMTFGKIGGLLATTPLVLMIGSVGWKNTFGIIALVSILVAAGAFVFVVDKKETLNKEPNGMFTAIGKLIKTKGFWMFCSAGALVGMTVPMIFSAWGGTFLTQGLGLDPTLSSTVILCGNLASCVGGITVAVICKKVAPKPLVVGSYAITVVLVAVMAIFINQLTAPAMFVIFILMGFVFYTSTTTVYSLMRDMCSVKYIGGFMGASNFISWLVGNALVSTIWGLFIPNTFSLEGFRNAMWFQLAICIVGLVLFIAMKPTMLPGCSDED
ncbi:MAG: MFS transporter [Clostridiales bacterium]|jgi:predicted MFS family arabinose efflux permease|nr:MFS transporter [Clostridiales bacterium]